MNNFQKMWIEYVDRDEQGNRGCQQHYKPIRNNRRYI